MVDKPIIGDAPHNRAQREALSGLIDSELDAGEAGRVLDAVCRDEGLRAAWIAYHAVGDALRSSEVAAGHSAAFCGRVAAAVAVEPLILSPRPVRAERTGMRRHLIPGLAIAASVAVLGFVAVPLMRAPEPASQTAQAVQVAPAARATGTDAQSAARAATTVANARAMQAYLTAHRELTTGVALPRATPYLRPATEAADSR